MRWIKLFEDFQNVKYTQEESDIFKKMVNEYTANRKLDLEDESALLAICKKMDLVPTDVHQDLQSKIFKVVDETIIISHRTEVFLNKLICAYESKHGTTDTTVIKSLCIKLGENFDDMMRNCLK